MGYRPGKSRLGWLPGSSAAMALVLLAGCAPPPPPVLDISGAVPAPSSYALATEDSDGAAPWRDLVMHRLGERGFAQGEEGPYLVQIGLADRPSKVGIAPRDDAAADKLRRRRRNVTTLSLAIMSRSTGQPVYKASASIGRSKPLNDELIGQLLDLILPPPATPEASGR